MSVINIVLVEPQIPQNTGNVARTCAVTGARLHLVGPMGFTPDDKKLKRAGLDYWSQLDITYYQDLSEFWAANRGPYFFFTSKGTHRHTDVSYPDGAYLVFGREDAGLPEELLAAHPAQCVRHPDAPGRAMPEPVQLGGCRRIRSAAAMGFRGPGDPRTTDQIRMEVRGPDGTQNRDRDRFQLRYSAGSG